ncbi:YlzJ-like family protein [Bacillus tianshenii]|nr:YlzJ-like family protein [Bacillus tianshenii]
MIHYTYLPQELIFPADEKAYSNQSVVTHNGVQMIVEYTSSSQCRIVRLLSSDPNHYLNQNYAPGTMMNLSLDM